MKLINSKTNRVYNCLASKNNVIAAWTAKVKPVTVTIDGTKVSVFGDSQKSNYIYFSFNSISYCVWAKDVKEFDFLTEKALKVHSVDKPKAVKVPTTKVPSTPLVLMSAINPEVKVAPVKAPAIKVIKKRQDGQMAAV